MFAKDIMSKDIRTISVGASMLEAQKLMQKSGIRHLPVHDGKKIVGIISDRDIQRSMAVLQLDEKKKDYHISPRKLVTEYMSSPVLRINQDEDVRSVTREMIHKKFSCFIVVDEDKNDVGILTTEDLLLLLTDMIDEKVSFLQKIKRIFSSRNKTSP